MLFLDRSILKEAKRTLFNRESMVQILVNSLILAEGADTQYSSVPKLKPTGSEKAAESDKRTESKAPKESALSTASTAKADNAIGGDERAEKQGGRRGEKGARGEKRRAGWGHVEDWSSTRGLMLAAEGKKFAKTVERSIGLSDDVTLVSVVRFCSSLSSCFLTCYVLWQT